MNEAHTKDGQSFAGNICSVCGKEASQHTVFQGFPCGHNAEKREPGYNCDPLPETIELRELQGPPFTVPRYSSYGAAVCAERDYLRLLLDEANRGHSNTQRIREYLHWWKHG